MTQLQSGTPIPTEMLAESFGGRGHEEAALGELLGPDPTLFVFLRHFG
jgi:hypothetical protein